MRWNLFRSRRTSKLRPTHTTKPRRLALEELENRWLPATINWTNPASGFFNVPANWSTNTVPTSTDDAVIGVSGITVTSSANA
jgi:hypothetical protein